MLLHINLLVVIFIADTCFHTFFSLVEIRMLKIVIDILYISTPNFIDLRNNLWKG